MEKNNNNIATKNPSFCVLYDEMRVVCWKELVLYGAPYNKKLT